MPWVYIKVILIPALQLNRCMRILSDYLLLDKFPVAMERGQSKKLKLTKKRLALGSAAANTSTSAPRETAWSAPASTTATYYLSASNPTSLMVRSPPS